MSTQNEPLNTLPIQQFLQKVKAADNSRAREVKMDIQTARNLSYALGMVMSRLEGDLERYVADQSSGEEKIEISVDGGSTW